MNKILTSLFLFFFSIGALLGQGFNDNPNSLYISVKDFGAKGDGIKDDTKSIQDAINFVSLKLLSYQPQSYLKSKLPYVGTIPTLFFPAGKYKITKPIKVGSYLNLKGEKAILFAMNPQVVCLEGRMWQSDIEGLQFIGFEKAISLDNKNVDQGYVHIRRCTFMGNRLGLDIRARSSIVEIKNCRFSHNDKAMVLESLKSIVEANWITSGKMSGQSPAQIDVYGFMHFNQNLLVPILPEQNTFEPAWINNYGTVTVSEARQGGEKGSFTLINSFVKYDKVYPVVHNSVMVKNSDCYAVYGNRKGYQQPAVLRLYNMPNQIVIEDIRGLVDASLINISERVSLDVPDTERKYITINIRNVQKYGNSVLEEILPNQLKSLIDLK